MASSYLFNANNANPLYNENVIEFMQSRNANRKGCIFKKMDVREMTFPDETFDLIIDKSTIDALLCGDNAAVDVATMLKEVQRVLKIGGYYMIISYGAPENRVVHLERKFLNFDVNIFTIKKSSMEDGVYDKVHYIYLCKKLSYKKAEVEEKFQQTLKEIQREEEEEEEVEENYNDDEHHEQPEENKSDDNQDDDNQ